MVRLSSVPLKSTKLASGIYCFVNRFNGKRYIGRSVNIEKRKKQHLGKLKKRVHHSRKFQKDFDEFGESAYDWMILCIAEKDQLEQIEYDLLKIWKPKLNNPAPKVPFSAWLDYHFPEY